MKQKDWGKDNRVPLYEVLPIGTPFSIAIGATSLCNFKCSYCMNSVYQSNYANSNMLSLDLFKKMIDDSQAFPETIKTIQFLKDGEPLVNKKLYEMVRYAKASKKYEKVELITNGALLNPEMNLKLIDAGLDTIRISLQGTTQEKYYEVAKVRINFEKFIANIMHFYQNKRGCRLHLKMINLGVSDAEEERAFYNTFENICDELSIQYTIPFKAPAAEYENVAMPVADNAGLNLYGEAAKRVQVCPRPFISMSISPDGTVMPCCRETTPDLVLGNIKNDSIVDLWNGNRMTEIRTGHLHRQRNQFDTCRTCDLPDHITYESDILDEFTGTLLPKYEAMRG